MDDEALLMEVLNSAPLLHGQPTDALSGDAGVVMARRHGGTGSDRELARVRDVRDALHGVIRGEAEAPAMLEAALGDVTRVPRVSPVGISWQIEAPADALLAARTAAAWGEVQERLPGRLRPCGNDECNLFLLDRTRPGTAKWCSMATCGNRMKARAYAQRQRNAAG